ncbi:MDM4 protein, partial [Origma solitaria]|nr:MDM4 protein [Origma solitaria]
CSFFPDQDSLEKLSRSKEPKAELVFEEWDVAGLPWWFLGNLRSNYNSRSNGSTDIQSNQDVDTAIVSDTTDDLWFLNECPLEQGNAGIKVELLESGEVTESDTKVPEEASLDELEDSQCLSDDTDTEPAAEDCWQCSKCRKFNSPGKRYCYRCWALRKDWYRDCPKIPHSLSLPSLDSIPNPERHEAVDVPDCRRTVSAPAGQPKHLFLGDPKPRADPGSESSDVARGGKNRDFPGVEKEEEEVESLESIKTLLSPCFLCQLRPRDGNIVHGRTAHLVACFRCARMLKRRRSPCPVCRKEIKMVIRIFMG